MRLLCSQLATHLSLTLLPSFQFKTTIAHEMASTSDDDDDDASTYPLGNYSLNQSLKRTLEIDHFQTKTSITDYKVERITSADGCVNFWLFLWPGGVHLKDSRTYSAKNVYITLRSEVLPPEFVVQFTVSLIDVWGERQLTQSK